MDLRKAAEAALEFLPRGDYSYLAANEPRSSRVARDIRAALAQPDMLAEAVKLLRAVRRGCNCGYDYRCSACQAAINASRFVSRYDAAQQEQNK